MRATHTQLAGYDSVTGTKRCTQKQIITELFYSEHHRITAPQANAATTFNRNKPHMASASNAAYMRSS